MVRLIVNGYIVEKMIMQLIINNIRPEFKLHYQFAIKEDTLLNDS